MEKSKNLNDLSNKGLVELMENSELARECGIGDYVKRLYDEKMRLSEKLKKIEIWKRMTSRYMEELEMEYNISEEEEDDGIWNNHDEIGYWKGN